MIDKTPYVQRFKEIYEKEYRVKITEEQAWEYFEKLLTLFSVVYRPLPEMGLSPINK